MSESFAAGLVGITLDERYRLDALVGEGGMGAVYRATHLAMDRRVAVKMLKPHLTTDATQLQRFAREARSTLKVDSPHAVKVLDFGVTPQSDYYMVLEYLDGRTVQRELDVDGPFAPARAVHIIRQALHALGAAHKRGLVHRDVKPDNILLMRVGTDPDYAKVLDFGVAKLMQGTARSDQSALALTQIGMVFGTPEFMSPEQACGHPLDGRSDLYSLAATLFAMLTGCALFEGKSPIEWLTHHARTPPPHLAMAQPGLAAYPELDELMQRCLAKHRERRPADAEEMDSLLAAVLPTLERAPGAPPPKETALRATLFSPSSYFDALPLETVDPGETLAPPDPSRSGIITSLERQTPSAIDSMSGSTANERPVYGLTESTRALPVQSRRRGVWLAIGAIAIVTMIGVAVGIALSRRTSRTASIPDAATTQPVQGDAVPAGVADATLEAGAPLGVDAPIDAPVVVVPDAAKAPIPGVNKKLLIEGHLKQALAAQRAGNRIQYLYWTELAYNTDPRSVRASLLYGDALVKTGSLDRGCQQLRMLKRLPEAQALLKSAGCPTD